MVETIELRVTSPKVEIPGLDAAIVSLKEFKVIYDSLAKLPPITEHQVARLKRPPLWSAFGKIERTRVRDVLVNLAQVRLLRRMMGKLSIEDELNETHSAKNWRGEPNFQRPLQKTEIAYLLSFDPEYLERQEICEKVRFAGPVDLPLPWSPGNPLADGLEEQ